MFRFFATVALLLTITNACNVVSDTKAKSRAFGYQSHSCRHGVGDIIYINLSKKDILVQDRPLGMDVIAKVCADKSTRQIYWVSYSMKTHEKCNYKKTFPWLHFVMNMIDVESVYKKVDDKLLMAQVLSHCEFNDENYKEATFLYMNTAPMEKKLMEGNWKMLGEHLREKMGKGEVAPQTIVGTIGQKEVLDEKVAVPKEWFRIVRFKKLNKQLVFIATNEEDEKPICSPAAECGFKPEVGKGRMYCCEFDKDLAKRLDMDTL